MRTLRSTCALAAVFCFTTLALSAQQPARGIFVTPIPYQPLTAIVMVQRTIPLPNGKTIGSHTTHLIARTAQGKIYNESRAYVPDGMPPTTALSVLLSVHIFDPRRGKNIFLNPRQQSGTQTIFRGPPSSVPPDFYAAPSAAAVERQNDFVKEEDLGWQKMLGLNVHGVRQAQVIPANLSGTGQEITISDEYWYSDDVRLNLLVKHTDPRTISTVQTVTVLKREEPDASLFVIPTDYKLNLPGANLPGNVSARQMPPRPSPQPSVSPQSEPQFAP